MQPRYVNYSFSSFALYVILVQWHMCISVTQAFDKSSYSQTYRGDGTYYGHTTQGHCSMRERLPKTYAGMLPVSLNLEQYDNSAACGACIEFRGTGRGSSGTKISTRKQLAYVHDSCGDCPKNDLDLSKNGDGRHEVIWKFVPCPITDVQLLFEGCNAYYKKIQIRGVTVPIVSATVNGKGTIKTPDNFFVAHGYFPSAGSIVAKDVIGNVYNIKASINVAQGLVIPKSVSKNGSPPRRPGNNPNPKPTKRPFNPKKCVKQFRICGVGRRCCHGTMCAKVGWSSARRCVKHSPNKCIPKYAYCTGPRKPKHAHTCCGRLRCRKPKSSHHKKCLPRLHR